MGSGRFRFDPSLSQACWWGLLPTMGHWLTFWPPPSGYINVALKKELIRGLARNNKSLG